MWHLLVSSCVNISQLYSVSDFKLVGYNVSYYVFSKLGWTGSQSKVAVQTMLDIDAWPTASKALMGIYRLAP